MKTRGLLALALSWIGACAASRATSAPTAEVPPTQAADSSRAEAALPDAPPEDALLDAALAPDSSADAGAEAAAPPRFDPAAVSPSTPPEATITLEGLRFVVRARPQAVRGGQGVELSVEAQSADGAAHWVYGDGILLFGQYYELSPNPNGAMGGGFGEGRSSGAQRVELAPGATPYRTARSYPANVPNWPAIRPGHGLHLEVRLSGWGPGAHEHSNPVLAHVVLRVPERGRPSVHVLPAAY